MPDPTPESLREAGGILARLTSLEATVADLASKIDAAHKREQDRDLATKVREAEERGRIAALQAAGLPDPSEASGVHVSPLGRPRIWESEDGRRVVKWVLGAMVLVALALAGGMTFADVRGFLPSSTTEQVLPDQGPPLPRYEGPQDDSPVSPRPAL